MAKTIKDTDYLVISARVKALETGLLTAERMEQILDAKSGEDAGKLLQEWGYPQLDPRRPEAIRGIVRRAGGHLGRLGGGNAGRPVYRSL